MKRLALAALALIAASLGGCVTPVGPVQVTRFHAADVSPLGKGTIAVEPAPGSDPASLEWQTYRSGDAPADPAGLLRGKTRQRRASCAGQTGAAHA